MPIGSLASHTTSAQRPATPSVSDKPTAILAKIVATIGPASEAPEVVAKLIDAGVRVFRFNFSHGSFDDHARRLAVVRKVSAELNIPVACLGDLQGPKIRVGTIPEGVGEKSRSGGGTITVVAGQDVIIKRGISAAMLRPGSHPGSTEPVLPTTYEPMIDEVRVGHKVLINDGAIRMLAVEVNSAAGELRCRVTSGGPITSGKGINLPQSDISAPSIGEHDWECAEWAVAHEMDFLALSFVRRAREVKDFQDRLAALCDRSPVRDEKGHPIWIPIVSKIEKPEALREIESIVEASDAIMVARGDLGVEMDIARVPVAQKQIIATCGVYGKPCIVATQMLETMIENTSPTRAEASDVANAIFDGADAVMLSAETATGKWPSLVVETMARIVAAAEERLASQREPAAPPTRLAAGHAMTAALAHGAWHIARDVNAKLVACWSELGGTARYLSQNNFRMPILAFSSSLRACRHMAMLAAVTPVCMDPPAGGTISELNAAIDRYVLAKGLAQPGDTLVLLAGRPLGRAKATNTIAVHRIVSA